VDVEDRREVEIDSHRTEFRGQRRCKLFRKRRVPASAQRDHRRPLSEGTTQPRYASAFLIDADPQRPFLLQGCGLSGELTHLRWFHDVAGEIDHAADVERRHQLLHIVRHGVTGESDDRQLSHVTPEIAKRHTRGHYNARVRIDCSAPTRIDLAGGTFDIWPLYLFHERAQTINAALSLRASCTLESRADGRTVLVSEDTDERVDAASTSQLGVDRLPLLARLIRTFDVSSLTVTTRSDSPVGAGIAGSSAMNIAITKALSAWTGRWTSDAEIMSIAMNVEAQVINVPTGAQDYRPALYGGISAVELDATGVRRVRLDVPANELSARVVVAYTGASRNSGINNWDVMKRRIDGDPKVIAAFDGIRDAALGMRAALTAQNWEEAGRQLDAEWKHRTTLAPGVTTPEITSLLAAARGAGALGGKVCGAGGGGCLFALVPPGKKSAVAAALTTGGARVLDCSIDDQGVQLTRTN
jgi:D-glycero-alpha-D-manno-heptose-7-phosphate kinase